MIERTIATLVTAARECINENTPFDTYEYGGMIARTAIVAEIIAGIGLVEGEYIAIDNERLLNKVGTITRFLAAYDHERESRRLPNTNSLIREAFTQ